MSGSGVDVSLWAVGDAVAKFVTSIIAIRNGLREARTAPVGTDRFFAAAAI